MLAVAHSCIRSVNNFQYMNVPTNEKIKSHSIRFRKMVSAYPILYFSDGLLHGSLKWASESRNLLYDKKEIDGP